jgi:hypothetical protein
MSVNGTLVEDKMHRFKGECAHLRFNKCPIYTHDGATAKYRTNSHETDNSVKDKVSKIKQKHLIGNSSLRKSRGKEFGAF